MTEPRHHELIDKSHQTDVDQKSKHLAQTIVEAAESRKAADLVWLRIADVSCLSDYFIIATGFSKTQVRAICDSIEEKVAQEHQQKPRRIAGKSEGSWILLDYGDVIVHIFLPQEREFYNLEAFWGHAEQLNFQPMLDSQRE